MSKPGPSSPPPEEAEVSRLLREAAGPVSLPIDLAARLDAVLADLVAERAAEPGARHGADPVAQDGVSPAVVTPLRRRRWPGVLVAAAAVSVLGFAGANFWQGQVSNDFSSGAADDGSTAELAPPDEAGGDTSGRETDSPDVDMGGTPGPNAPVPSFAETGGVEKYFMRDQGLLIEGQALEKADLLRAQRTRQLNGVDQPQGVRDCLAPATRPGDTSYEVTLQSNRRAVVVIHPLAGSSARAAVYLCRQPSFPVHYELLLAAR